MHRPRREDSGLVQVQGFSAVFAGTWRRWVPQKALCGLRPIQVQGFFAIYAETWPGVDESELLTGRMPVELIHFFSVFLDFLCIFAAKELNYADCFQAEISVRSILRSGDG